MNVIDLLRPREGKTVLELKLERGHLSRVSSLDYTPELLEKAKNPEIKSPFSPCPMKDKSFVPKEFFLHGTGTEEECIEQVSKQYNEIVDQLPDGILIQVTRRDLEFQKTLDPKTKFAEAIIGLIVIQQVC